MSREDEQKELAAARAAQLGDKGKSKGGNMMQAEDEAADKQLGKNDGIALKFFKKNCSFLAGCLPSIVERILKAHGLDIESANTSIDWHRFLDLYCIFEAGKMDKKMLIRFWVKFFDIGDFGKVPKKDYLKLLEELVRGNTLNHPNSTTKMFAKMFQKMMLNAGCLHENKDLDTDRLT